MIYEEELARMEGYADSMQPKPGEQRSIEWLTSRIGHVTASNIKHVMDVTAKGKPTEKRNKYLLDVVIERLTGKSTEHYVSAAMEHGTQYEPQARRAYEIRTGKIVVEVGFLHHKIHTWVGGSPDGLIGDDGGLEIKAPTTATHINTIISDDVSAYFDQCQGLMWVCDRQWWDLASFDPRLPEGLKLYVQRIHRDNDYIAELAAGVLNFLAEVDAMESKLRERIIVPELDETQEIPVMEA